MCVCEMLRQAWPCSTTGSCQTLNLEGKQKALSFQDFLPPPTSSIWAWREETMTHMPATGLPAPSHDAPFPTPYPPPS